jgi:GTP-binding protein Era
MSSTKTGYVAILGKPNVGKSTLMNALLGQKISIITSKPQTTRKRILGILSSDTYQIIFFDTPGILEPAYLLHEKMMEHVGNSVRDADVIVLILDVDSDPDGARTLQDEHVLKFLAKSRKKKILLINKIDLTTQDHVKLLLQKYGEASTFEKIIPVSAKLNFNLQEVILSILEFLPEGPKYYPDDSVADANERFFVSEIIREKLFEQYKEEIPYSCEVLIAEFKERDAAKYFIGAEIVVERETQKAIIIGKQGAAIKKLGERSRKDVEEFLEHHVYLELRVKVRDKWRSDENMLRSFGYTKDDE